MTDIPVDPPVSLSELLDQTLERGPYSGKAFDRAATDRLLKAIRTRSANHSHILIGETEADKAAGRPIPHDDPAYLLLLFPEALNTVMSDALNRMEEIFDASLDRFGQATEETIKRVEETLEPKFEAAADRAFVRAGDIIRKHSNDLDVLTKKLHAEMAEHVARHKQLQTTTRLFFESMGAGLLATAEARVKEDAEYSAQLAAKAAAAELREVVREAVREELAQSNKGLGSIFKR